MEENNELLIICVDAQSFKINSIQWPVPVEFFSSVKHLMRVLMSLFQFLNYHNIFQEYVVYHPKI